MDKIDTYKIKQKYEIAILYRNKWIILNEGVGITTLIDNKMPKIRNLEIENITKVPVLRVFKSKFNMQILLTILQKMDNVTFNESKLFIEEANIYYNEMKLKIYENNIVYRGKSDKFKNICKEILKTYNESYRKYEKLFRIKAENYKSIAYKTWYNAARENQREWPYISLKKKEGAIEFPKGSKVYYWHDKLNVGLSIRKDTNSEKYIPKLFKRNQLENKESVLYRYLNDINIIDGFKINSVIRQKYKLLPKDKIVKLSNEKYLEIDYNAEEIEVCNNAKVLVYMGYIISCLKQEIIIDDFEAQILNKEGKRLYVLKDGKWVQNYGPKIRDVIALPYNYKQIIHDYNKLNRLKKGKLMDLTHIGIVNEEDNDIITYPDINNLYVSNTLETHRLMTFKVQKNIKINISI